MKSLLRFKKHHSPDSTTSNYSHYQRSPAPPPKDLSPASSASSRNRDLPPPPPPEKSASYPNRPSSRSTSASPSPSRAPLQRRPVGSTSPLPSAPHASRPTPSPSPPVKSAPPGRQLNSPQASNNYASSPVIAGGAANVNAPAQAYTPSGSSEKQIAHLNFSSALADSPPSDRNVRSAITRNPSPLSKPSASADRSTNYQPSDYTPYQPDASPLHNSALPPDPLNPNFAHSQFPSKHHDLPANPPPLTNLPSDHEFAYETPASVPLYYSSTASDKRNLRTDTQTSVDGHSNKDQSQNLEQAPEQQQPPSPPIRKSAASPEKVKDNGSFDEFAPYVQYAESLPETNQPGMNNAKTHIAAGAAESIPPNQVDIPPYATPRMRQGPQHYAQQQGPMPGYNRRRQYEDPRLSRIPQSMEYPMDYGYGSPRNAPQQFYRDVPSRSYGPPPPRSMSYNYNLYDSGRQQIPPERGFRMANRPTSQMSYQAPPPQSPMPGADYRRQNSFGGPFTAQQYGDYPPGGGYDPRYRSSSRLSVATAAIPPDGDIDMMSFTAQRNRRASGPSRFAYRGIDADGRPESQMSRGYHDVVSPPPSSKSKRDMLRQVINDPLIGMASDRFHEVDSLNRISQRSAPDIRQSSFMSSGTLSSRGSMISLPSSGHGYRPQSMMPSAYGAEEYGDPRMARKEMYYEGPPGRPQRAPVPAQNVTPESLRPHGKPQEYVPPASAASTKYEEPVRSITGSASASISNSNESNDSVSGGSSRSR
ncbi:hypothetical protein CANCADRAFT_43606 [Tortispora caseinolytica NRRL Y-17796]|uniref:Uncharacterized protein n=1 Tax=Tortispora caseinolytica NRRL Y-17796 TaxID=767744 RepID=A0A1E4TDS6_9ASCO|nr:hypothetical protein CANCADRAFT_43606 [Tortispora caseinolytica NRRL Y-17796]